MATPEMALSPIEAADAGAQPLALRILTATVWFIGLVARTIWSELVYMYRADLAHGRIERTPEDWER